MPSSAETYYVKLKEVTPGSGEVLGAFAGPGRTLTIDVPLNGNHTTTYALNYELSPGTWCTTGPA